MLSDLQLVYMGPRNSTQLKINTTKFQVEREPVYRCVMFCQTLDYACSQLQVNDVDLV